MNVLKRLILSKCPDYDFDRYRFKFGDIVETLDGAKIFVKSSALSYVEAFILKSSFTLRRHNYAKVPYDNLPDKPLDTQIQVQTKLRWSVGDFVKEPLYGMVVLLTEKVDNGFYGLVVESSNPYYRETSIYITNPYQDYIKEE